MLAYYCRHFPVVELNFTFYRLPTPSMLARMAEQTPEGFQFIVKLPRSLSHEENAAELSPFREAVVELHRRRQLMGLLCQLPQASHFAPEHLNWLRTLAAELAGYRLAVEFRHCSWFRDEVPCWLAEHDLDLVSVDVPDIAALYPRGLVRSGPRLYIRFHSRNGANWYRSEKERYDYTYQDETLLEWVRLIGQAAESAGKALLLFNNCQRGQAATNAKRMRELLSRTGTEFEVPKPFSSSSTTLQQPSLFDEGP
jgi:uncharacterized protein YecE (DUF72 family)